MLYQHCCALDNFIYYSYSDAVPGIHFCAKKDFHVYNVYTAVMEKIKKVDLVTEV